MTTPMGLPERAQRGSLAIKQGTPVAFCMPSGTWFFGKFRSAEDGEVCIDDVVGQVLGEQGTEYRVRPGMSVYLRESVAAIVPAEWDEAKWLIHPPSSYVLNLGKYVAVKAGGDIMFGKLAVVNLAVAHLQPYLGYRQLERTQEAYVEEVRPAIINADSITAMFPITEQDLVNRVAHYNEHQAPLEALQRDIHGHELSQRHEQIVQGMRTAKKAGESSTIVTSEPSQ